MRKKLLITLFLLFSFIPVFSVNALTGNDGVDYPEAPDGRTRYIIFKTKDNNTYLVTIGNDTQYVASTVWYSNSNYSSYNTTSLYFYKVPVSTGSGTGCQDYDPTICTTDIAKSNYSTEIIIYEFKNNNWSLSNLTIPRYWYNVTNILYSTENIYYRTDAAKSTYLETSYFIPGEHGGNWTKTGLERAYEDLTYMSDVSALNLEEKKNFSYNNDEMTNPMRYIDLYFNKEDLGKKINFSIKFEDFFDYSSCSYCEYLNIEKFEFSYLIQDENGLYKWVDISNTSAGVGFDYDGETLPKNEDGSGFEITGRIDLDYNTTTYDFKKIRASIKLSNGYNFKYTYSDDSNISLGNIDEYYHYMTYDSGKRLNRIDSGITKYTILSTTQNEINASLLVEYINTSKYLYVEYFDTLVNSYISNGMIYSYDYFLIDNRDIEKFDFKIGKNNNRGIYLMNYLYQKNNENLDSKYYFYIPTEVSYSYTDFLNESIYYNSTGSITDGIISNPNYETDNTKFIDNFRIIYNFLEDLQQTSDTFNYMWNNFYAVMPNILKTFLQVITHLLCIWVFMKIVGYD